MGNETERVFGTLRVVLESVSAAIERRVIRSIKLF